MQFTDNGTRDEAVTPGQEYAVAVAGTSFGAGTVSLKWSVDAVTWVDFINPDTGSAYALTANWGGRLLMPGRYFRAVLAGATSPNLGVTRAAVLATR